MEGAARAGVETGARIIWRVRGLTISAQIALLSVDGPCLKQGVWGRRGRPMIFDLITAFVVACATVTASEMLPRIWEYF